MRCKRCGGEMVKVRRKVLDRVFRFRARYKCVECNNLEFF